MWVISLHKGPFSPLLYSNTYEVDCKSAQGFWGWKTRDPTASQWSGWFWISLVYVPRSRRHHAACDWKLASALHSVNMARQHNYVPSWFEGQAHTKGSRVWPKWDRLYEMWCSFGAKRAGIRLSSTHGEPTEEHVRFFHKVRMRGTFEMDTWWHFVRLDRKEWCAWGYLESRGYCNVFFQLR